eukprot:5301470-Prymnesium_polylepis.1
MPPRSATKGPRPVELTADGLRKAFAFFDRDGSGQLNKAEISTILANPKSPRAFQREEAEMAASRVIGVFAGEDSELNYEEFVQWWSRKELEQAQAAAGRAASLAEAAAKEVSEACQEASEAAKEWEEVNDAIQARERAEDELDRLRGGGASAEEQQTAERNVAAARAKEDKETAEADRETEEAKQALNEARTATIALAAEAQSALQEAKEAVQMSSIAANGRDADDAVEVMAAAEESAAQAKSAASELSHAIEAVDR